MTKNRKKVIAFLCTLVIVMTSVAGPFSFGRAEAVDTKVVTFADFGVKDGKYGLYVTASGSLDLSASGNCGKTSLDGIVFHGKVKFSEEAPFTISFFGKNNGWQGLRFSSKTDGNLYLNVIKSNNISAYAKTLSSDTAGTKLTGEVIDLKLSVQYIDQDGDGVKDDVKLGILFNNVLYDNKYINLDGAVDYLGSYIGIFGDKNNANSMVAVASVGGNLPDEGRPDKELEKITFADFGVKDDTYKRVMSSNGTDVSLTTSGNCGKASLDGILFHGKVKFSEEAPFTISFFGNKSGWLGLRLSSTSEGNLTLKNYLKGWDSGTDTFKPEVAGTKLTGEEIDLKLSVQYVDNDGDGVKDDVKFGVWFNDVLYDNKYIYKEGAADYLGSYIGIYGDKSNASSMVTVASAWELEEITFTDFGVEDATYGINVSTSGSLNLSASGDCGKTSLDGILFHGKVKFSEEAPFTISFFGSDSAWKGLRFSSKTDGNLYLDFIKANNISGYAVTLHSDTAGTKLTGEIIDLKLSLQYADQDGDGVKDDVKLGIWFNDKLYNNILIYLDGAVANLGSYIGIFGDKSNDNTKVTVASVGNFNEITFRDFGVKDGAYKRKLSTIYPDTVSLSAEGSYDETGIDGILFRGKVKYSEEAPFTISFFGKESGWRGLRLSSTEDGNLTLKDELGRSTKFGTYTLLPAVAGTELTGEEIYLKLSVQCADQDGDGVKDDVKLGIWFNDVLYDNQYFYLDGAADYLGSYIGIFGDKSSNNSMVAVTSVGSLKEITFAHFGVRDDEYRNCMNGEWLDLSAQGIYEETGIDGILFHGEVMFSEEASSTISFFGKDSAWKGLRFSSTAEGNLYLNVIKANNISGYARTLYSDTAGTKLTGEKIDLKLSVQYVDHDKDGVKDDVKLGIWFNDAIYDNQYIYLDDGADYLGNYIGIYCEKADSTVAVTSIVNIVNFSKDDTPMDIRDLVALKKYVDHPASIYDEWYDLNGDGKFGVEDTTRMRKLLVGSYEIIDGQTIVPAFNESYFDKTYDFIGGKDVMPIGGYFGPYDSAYAEMPDYVTDEIMQLISDSGINLITYSALDYAASPARIQKYLDLGEKYGVGIFVKDTNITSKAGSDSLNIAKLKKQLTYYYDHPAFCGLYLVDEPDAPYYIRGDGKRMISMYGDLANVLQYDLKIPCYSNMLPCTSSDYKEDYERYVEEFCDTFKPKVIMWDYYILDPYGKESIYFWNMDLMRQQSQKNGVPFWAFIQAGGRWRSDDKYLDSDTYHPTEGEFNWNVNTCLAFGVQGIQYFPLIQPDYVAYIASADGDFEASGIIGAKGNKTQWYGFAQNINKHIRVIDEVLMNSVHQGLIVKGTSAKADVAQTSCVIDSGNFRELESVSCNSILGNAMVGCFDYNGKTALYVVNYSTQNAQKITLNFNNACNIKITQNAENSYVNAKTLTLNMAAGEGVMLVIE